MAKKAKTRGAARKDDVVVDVSAPSKRKKGKVIDATARFAINQPQDTIIERSISEFSQNALRVYGSYVVEERAVPDFRDGLKPVHRSLLWSLNDLSLRPDKGYKKSARTVGHCIGIYHPHGDAAAYSAMVTIANTMPPAVDGQGNWGTPVDPAAAQRYTEAKMSKFSHLFMLDSKYLDVVPKIPNFSGDAKIPLYLPALLPYALFNGNTPAPAYGVRAGNPSFSFKSVAKVVIAMLRGKEVTAKALAKTLEVQHAYGCNDVTSPDDLIEHMKTGKGSMTYAPKIEVDYKKAVIYIQSFVPGGLASPKQIDASMLKLVALDGVRKAYSEQGKKSKMAGPYGALMIVECQKLPEDKLDDLVEKIERVVTNTVSYRLGITIRKAEEANVFKYLDYVTFFQQWIKYRVALETRLIKSLIKKAERDLFINEVYLFAVENMDKLLKVLPKVLVAKDPDAALAKALNIPIENATIILDRKVRQLAKMEAAALKDKINALKQELKQLAKDLKNPGERAANDTTERVKRYLKNPDVNKSGLLFE